MAQKRDIDNAPARILMYNFNNFIRKIDQAGTDWRGKTGKAPLDKGFSPPISFLSGGMILPLLIIFERNDVMQKQENVKNEKPTGSCSTEQKKPAGSCGTEAKKDEKMGSCSSTSGKGKSGSCGS